MTNRLRTQAEREEEKKIVVEERQARDLPDNFFIRFFTKGIMDAEAATRALPLILFLAFLGMLYIANRHYAEKAIRDIDKINRDVRELSVDYKTTKAELAYRSTITEVAKRADTLGVKESPQPPFKIKEKEAKDEH